MIGFYERPREGGGLYIAVKIGMILAAVIAPFDEVNEDFVEKLREITKDCEIALSIKRRNDK